MAVLTVRNVPAHVHRALRLRAAQHGRSTEAEVRAILESAVKPEDRVKLGSVMANIGRRVGLTEGDVAALERAMDEARDRKPAQPMPFE
jgi:plasmid stability protein